MADEEGGLNGSTQYLFEVYSQESESLRFSSGVDLSAALLCPDPTGYSRTGLFSSGSIAVILQSAIPGQRAPQESWEFANLPAQCSGDRRGVFAGHLYERGKARMAFHQGHNVAVP